MSFRYGVNSRCSNCGKPVSREAEQCPHCGVHFSGEKWIKRKNKSKINSLLGWKHYVAIVALIAIVALCAFAMFSPSDNSVSEINHVNDISIAVGENDLGLSSVVTYGFDEDGGVTTEFEKIDGNLVTVSIRDNKHNVTQEDVDKIISGVLEKDDSLVRINDTTVGGKFNNYTYVAADTS